ncbi:MAG: ribosome-associated translation inhibitor RaiA [Kiritimatiellales bacterium]|nr:ribosome-associated translation inhibitor RaiA [Kiritimatiellales bacterium]
MQINITGRHEHLTNNVKAHVNDKLERCLGGFTRIESVHVILESVKRVHVAEIVVQATNHIRIAAKEESENLYAAIDAAVDHAERQLRKQRDKVQDHHK